MPSYANQTVRLQKQSLPVFPTQTSFTQLFGDTFAQTPASSLYLLEDLTGIGATLTNNNGVLFPQVTDLTIKPVNVAEFDGVDQFLSTPTATANEVGTGSFVASIWFRNSELGSQEWLVFYGDQSASEQGWGFRFDGNDDFFCSIDDGTIFQQCIDSIGGLRDGTWHIATMLVDRDPLVNLMTLLIDGKLSDTTDISTVTNTLTNAGTDLLLGCSFNGINIDFYTGQLANFQLYLSADYNLPTLLESGLRESANIGGVTSIAVTASARLTQQVDNTNADGQYSTCVINTSEGIYDLLSLNILGTARGIREISIDGNIVETFDMFNGSTVFNSPKTTSGIYLTAGTHILKYAVNGTSNTGYLTTFSMLELIKRDGNNEGDDESTTGTILSDEIIQRTNADFASEVSTQRVFNQRFFLNPSVTGDFTEGDIFIKKGLYDITINADQSSIRAAFNLWFGGVKVLDEDTFWDNASSTNNVPKTVSVFLEGGKTTVRWETGSTATGTFSGFNYIKYDLVTGRGNNDTVDIFPNDPFFEVQNTLTNGINTAYRFNAFSSITSPQVQNDEYGYRKYFSGGTYKVKWVNITATNQGIADVFLDGDPTDLIYDNVDLYSASLGTNVEHFTIKTIPRGYHAVHLKAVDKNASSSAYNITLQIMEFTKIADIESTEDDNSDPVHGALVPLGNEIAQNGDSSLAIQLGGVDVSRFSALEIYYKGRSNAAQALWMTVNGFSTGYYQNGFNSAGATLTNQQISNAAQFTLLDATTITAANRIFSGKIDIELSEDLDSGFNGFSKGGVAVDGMRETHLYINGFGAWDPSLLLTFQMNTSSFQNMDITVYGVLK